MLVEGMVQRVQMAQKEGEGEPCLRHLTLLRIDNCYVPQGDHAMLQGLAVIAMPAVTSREGDKDRDWRQRQTH